MSRHLLTCDDPDLVLVVGWDEGLGSFFAQVEPPGPGYADDLLLWVGTYPGEVVDTAELAALVRRWAHLDDWALALLEEDRCARR